MKLTITINEYPIGWEWLDKVPLEQKQRSPNQNQRDNIQ